MVARNWSRNWSYENDLFLHLKVLYRVKRGCNKAGAPMFKGKGDFKAIKNKKSKIWEEI